jgi:hypothetical protein
MNEAQMESLRERFFEMPPDERFMFGTHYSTPLYVLYYLVRQTPQYMLRFTAGAFDLPDRLFSSVEEAWLGVKHNPSDHKELIPEFFASSGRFLTNFLGLHLGVRQDGRKIDAVHLPAWAADAADFVRQMRAALESDLCSDELHLWIDLIFGYRSRGEHAVLADNVFFPLTYSDSVNLDEMADPTQRKAAEVQVNEFGQVPPLLFDQPHPPRLAAPLPAAEARAELLEYAHEVASLTRMVEDRVSYTALAIASLHFPLTLRTPAAEPDGHADEQQDEEGGTGLLALASSHWQCLVLVGPAGSGKTWLLQQTLLAGASGLASALAEASADSAQQPLVPIYVPLAHLERYDPSLLHAHFAARYGRASRRYRLLLEVLHSGRALLLLDGIDETFADAPHVLHWLRHVALPAGWKVVVTTRAAGAVGDVRALVSEFAALTNGRCCEVEIASFSDGARGQYLKSRLSSSATRPESRPSDDSLRPSPAKSFPVLLHPATRELCARPLFLSVLHLLLEALEPQLAEFSVSELRARFLAAIVQHLLHSYEERKDWGARAIERRQYCKRLAAADAAQVARFAEELAALVLLRRRRSNFTEADVHEMCKQEQERNADIAAAWREAWLLLKERCALFRPVVPTGADAQPVGPGRCYEPLHVGLMHCLVAQRQIRIFEQLVGAKYAIQSWAPAYQAAFPEAMRLSRLGKEALKLAVALMTQQQWQYFVQFLLEKDFVNWHLLVSLLHERKGEPKPAAVLAKIQKLAASAKIGDQLVDAMARHSSEVRQLALGIFQDLELDTSKARARLIDILRQKSCYSRRVPAILSLERLERAFGADLRALLLAIISDDSEAIDVRSAAMHAIGRQEPVHSSVDTVMAVALHGACGRGGGDGDILAAAALDVLRQQSFLEWLQEEMDKDWRYIQVLARIALHENWVWRKVVDHIWSPETDLVQRITLVEELEASLLRSSASRPDGLVNALLKLVCDRDATMQAVVLRTLRSVGLESDDQVRVLVQQLGVEQVKAVRKEIVLVLSAMPFPSAHGAMLGLLRSDEAELRQMAIESLGNANFFCSDQAATVAALEWFLDNESTPSDHVRVCIALCTLSGMAHSRALDGLLDMTDFPTSEPEPASISYTGSATPQVVVASVSARFKKLGISHSLAHKAATTPVAVEWFDLANRALRALRGTLQAAPPLAAPECARIQARLLRLLQTSQDAANTTAGSDLIGLNSVIVETVTTLGCASLRSAEVVEALLSCVGVPTGMEDTTSAMEDEIAQAAVAALVELGSLTEEVGGHAPSQRAISCRFRFRWWLPIMQRAAWDAHAQH